MNKVGALDKMTLGRATTEFKPGTAMTATSTVEISIACRNLANKDVLSKSDPICVVYQKPMNSKSWREILRTEILQNNLNPDFAQKLTMEYRFEQAQNIRFEVYDIDSPTSILGEQDTIGHVECTVANIVSAGPTGYTHELISQDPKPGISNGTIILIAEELASLKDEVCLKLSGSSVGSLLTCFLPKAFYTLSRVNDANHNVVIHRSNEVRSSNPTWPPLTISGRSLCNGDKDRQLRIEAYRINFKGEDEFVGGSMTSLNRMSNMLDSTLQLVGKNGAATKSAVSILSCTISPVFTFLDYVQAGTKIHLCFSIDFTSSNGDPTQATSLHHISNDPNFANPYEQAIEATGLIIKDYDDTGIFPVYGFGARIPPNGATSHDFPVTLSSTPNCKGIAGVMRAYRQCISKIQLYGPTNFAPVINRVAETASKSRPGQHYFVLVILTDGVITDVPQTKEAIVKAAVFPISIIIVGVGESDFTSMEELDGDEGVVTYNGRPAERDIVQFVAYRNAESWLHKTGELTASNVQNAPAFLGAGGGGGGGGGLVNLVSNASKQTNNSLAQGQLAEEILAEIPEQLTSYMKARGIEPSMILKEDSESNPVFSGAVTTGDPELVGLANTTAAVEKFKVNILENKEAEDRRREEEEEERRRKEDEERKKKGKLAWSLFSLIGKFRKNKLKADTRKQEQEQPLSDQTEPNQDIST